MLPDVVIEENVIGESLAKSRGRQFRDPEDDRDLRDLHKHFLLGSFHVIAF
jgi:hypothetical protein